MIEIYPLFSGSKGNAIVVSGNGSTILIDCGVSCRRLCSAIERAGLNPYTLQGIFITHEHADHIQGIRVFTNRFKTPVYATQPTWQFLEQDRLTVPCRELVPDVPVDMGGLSVTGFQTSHDAACSVGYKISDGTIEVGIATDMGVVTDTVRDALGGCKKVLLEANHDLHMLDRGPYPYPLKCRIKGEKGHLSNEAAGELATYLVEHGTDKLLLGHLSEHNNTPAQAYGTVTAFLQKKGMIAGKDIVLKVAKPSLTGV